MTEKLNKLKNDRKLGLNLSIFHNHLFLQNKTETREDKIRIYFDSAAFLAARFSCWLRLTLCFLANFRFLKNLGSIWKQKQKQNQFQSTTMENSLLMENNISLKFLKNNLWRLHKINYARVWKHMQVQRELITLNVIYL